MKNKKMNFGLIMIVYLLGIFMGAIDTGIVTPARTVIQNDLMVNWDHRNMDDYYLYTCICSKYSYYG